MMQLELAHMWSMPAFVGPWLVAITILLALALATCWALCRTSAGRHAVLVGALVADGFAPITFLATKFGGIAPAVRLPISIVRSMPQHESGGPVSQVVEPPEGVPSIQVPT
jgi:hypothetical protein